MRAKRFLRGADGILVPVFGATANLFDRLQIEFAYAPVAVQRTTPTIVVFSKPNHRHFGTMDDAHCHEPDSIKICIAYRRYFCGLLRHEMTHAYLFAQPLWMKRWRTIAGRHYIGARWANVNGTEIERLVLHGFLAPYCAKEPHEDAAYLAEACYRWSNHLCRRGQLERFPTADSTSNVRLINKVRELRHLGAITNEEYRSVIQQVTRRFPQHITIAPPSQT